MVPVELRLRNFLSYGTEAPPLDFRQFHVACLSGKNGQGKSALLDAITWALWGEARKSSGGHKPDDELIRIGARRMVVELVFDLEGERYRILRSYTRSASGKTSKSELELQVLDADSGDGRPLTGVTMRETQAYVDNLLGIDYQTFINSAFLLQGRSDEFTKKKPSERKEILARILDLDKYERLARMARDRERDLARTIEAADQEIERMQAGLEEEATWKETHQKLEADLQADQERLQAARAEEQDLATQAALLGKKDDERKALLRQLDELRHDEREANESLAARRAALAEADALIARRDDIETRHGRFQALDEERADLDTKREQYRGVEKRLDQARLALSRKRMEMEHQLRQLEADLKNDREAFERACEEAGREQETLQRLEAARAAARRCAELEALARRHRAFASEVENLDRRLFQEEERLRHELRRLEEEDTDRARRKQELDRLEARRTELCTRLAGRDALAEELDHLVHEGQRLGELLKEREGRLSVLNQRKAEQVDVLHRLHLPETSRCPTCGSELNAGHRAQVLDQLRDELEALERTISESRDVIEAEKVDLATLRGRYKTRKKELGELEPIARELGDLEADIRNRQRDVALQDDLPKKTKELRSRLERGTFAPDVRAERDRIVEEQGALGFDEEERERLLAEAARVAPLEQDLQRIRKAILEKGRLEEIVTSREGEVRRQRQSLDDGSAWSELKHQVKAAEEQLARIGFDPELYNEVKRTYEALKGVQGEFFKLANALASYEQINKEKQALEAKLGTVERRRTAVTRHIEELEADVAGREAVEAQRSKAARRCEVLEATVRTVQASLGELSARLGFARRQREEIRTRKKHVREARNERSLYRQLRQAFGKNGIPSLIIEQTLPEIEERANELLDRLTEGRMHVRLETLKDRKTGGTRETLEIIITDEQGVPRPYETFSGGEAFRVNFALRIALSQILAERSGVRIRTLGIDEGFGTQDEDGIRNLIEAIQVIQDDFDKILVITHLDTLKEAFPVRIEVAKDPAVGSQFELIGV